MDVKRIMSDKWTFGSAMIVHREMIRRGKPGLFQAGQVDVHRVDSRSSGYECLVALANERDEQNKGKWRGGSLEAVTLPVRGADYDAYSLNYEGLVGRANMISLEEMFNGAIEDDESIEASCSVHWITYGGAVTLTLWDDEGRPLKGAKRLAKIWFEARDSLENYPLLDEELHSYLEQDWQASSVCCEVECHLREWGVEMSLSGDSEESEHDSDIIVPAEGLGVLHALFLMTHEGQRESYLVSDIIESVAERGDVHEFRYSGAFNFGETREWNLALCILLSMIEGVTLEVEEGSPLFDHFVGHDPASALDELIERHGSTGWIVQGKGGELHARGERVEGARKQVKVDVSNEDDLDKTIAMIRKYFA